MKIYLLAICCFLLMRPGVNAQAKKILPPSILDSGKTMHFVDMTDINGNQIKASDLKGKTVVMNFWFLGCPPCRFEIPILSKIADSYKDNKDIVFIAVALDSPDSLKNFLKTNPFSYRLVGDGKQIHHTYGIDICPLSLVVNKEGTIIYNSYTERFVMAASAHITDILKAN